MKRGATVDGLLLQGRLANNNHVRGSRESVLAATFELHADGWAYCPRCERPLGDVNGAGVAAANALLEPSCMQRRLDFTGFSASGRQTRRAAVDDDDDNDDDDEVEEVNENDDDE